jgi:hypothetical protein
MAPGFFGKMGDFFKKIGTGIKTGLGKVMEVGKKVLQPVAKVAGKIWDVAKPIATPLIQGFAASKGIDPSLTEFGLGLGENLLGKIAGNKPQEQYDEQEDPGAAQYLKQRRRR